MKNLLAIAITLCASTYAYAQAEWIDIASHNDGTKWAVQAGSLELSKTKGGVSIAVVVGRISNPNTSSITLNKWYASASDCSKKMGKIVTLDVGGDYKYENDFVIGAGNIASSIAEAICGAADYRIKEKNAKSL